MASFVHFTDEKNRNSIIKNGISAGKIHYEKIKKGVFCMQVIPDFYATNQWVREIKQYNSGNNIIAVYFKIPDDEMLFCGKYTDDMIFVKAAEAHRIFISHEDKMGFQAILARKVSKNEITKVKNIPQITGWRHFPKSHDKKRCLCPACLSKGTYNYNKIINNRLGELFKKLRNSHNEEEIKETLGMIEDNIYRFNGKIEPRDGQLVKEYLGSGNDGIKYFAIRIIAQLYGGQYKDYFLNCIYEEKGMNIVDTCIQTLYRIFGKIILDEIDVNKCSNEVLKIISEYRDE